MLSDRSLKLKLDGGEAEIEFPIEAVSTQHAPGSTKIAYVVSVSSEELLRALDPSRVSEAAGEQAEAQRDPWSFLDNPADEPEPEPEPEPTIRRTFEQTPNYSNQVWIRQEGGDWIKLGFTECQIDTTPPENDMRFRDGWVQTPGQHTVQVTLDEYNSRRLAETLGVVIEPKTRTTDPLAAWWLDDAEEVVRSVAPKAREYGSTELIEAGRALTKAMGEPEPTDQEAMERAIYAYVVGKIGRWTAALERGDRVSDDTLLDLMVYANMVRKIRETGEWHA